MSIFLDKITSFHLRKGFARGYIVSLDPLLNSMGDKHHYPMRVNSLLNEMVALCAVLKSCFKFDGVFTLQLNGAGPIQLLMVDINTKGHVRSCARFDKDYFQKNTDPLEKDLISTLMGKGSLLFTIDPEFGQERYQGVVELMGNTIAECLQHYFFQSEQLLTGFQVASSNITPYKARALMIQRLPMEKGDEQGHDNWHRLMSFMATLKPEELLNSELSDEKLLHQLFWDDELVMTPHSSLIDQCHWHEEKIRDFLKSLPAEDLDQLVTPSGDIQVTCDFCNQNYHFQKSVL